MIYVLLIAMILLIGLHIYMSYNMMMDFCHLMAKVDRAYDIVNKWAIYYVSEQWANGNNAPFDFIFPNDREEMEKELNNDNKEISK